MKIKIKNKRRRGTFKIKKCEKCGKTVLFGKLTDGLCDNCNKEAKANSTVGDLNALKMENLEDSMPDIDADMECDGDCANCNRNHSDATDSDEMEQHASEEFEGKRPCTNVMSLSIVLNREAGFDIDLFSVITTGFTSVGGLFKGKKFLITMLPKEVMILTGDAKTEAEITELSEIVSQKVDPTFKKHYRFYDSARKNVNFMWGYNSFDKCKATLEVTPGTGEVVLLEE